MNAWIVAGLAAVAAAVWIALGYQRTLRDRQRYREILRDVFYGAGYDEPVMEAGSSYSYPTIRVCFRSEEGWRRSDVEGRQQTFLSEIQRYHEHVAGFDANLAVYFTWEGRPPPAAVPFDADDL